MAEYLAIPPSNLLVDLENPRLPQPNAGQREAQRALAKHLQRKLLVLAGDIIQHGLNPGDLPFVMPLAGDDLNRYIVLEGNRRLVALRALESPDSFFGAFDGNVLKQMQNLSRKYHTNPVDSIYCAVVKDRAEAKHWIELRHGGELEGAGIVKWGAEDSARFKARSPDTVPIATQALNFLEEGGYLKPEERRDVPVATLTRLLDTPELRNNTGFVLKKGKLELVADRKKAAKALLYVVKDLTSGDTNTKHVYSKEKRIEYANNLPARIKAKPTLKTSQPIFPVPEGDGREKQQPQARAIIPKQRDYLIPRDCLPQITHPRIKAIETELRRLNLGNYPNAVAVLFRVFIELSADEYILRHKVSVTAHDKLRNKLEAVLDDLLGKAKLNSQQAKPVRKAMARDSYLLPSIDLMHDYIHNQNAFPAGSDLRAHWDSLQPFILAVWSP